VVAGRGGIPVDADGYLPSFGAEAAASTASAGGPVISDTGSIASPRMALALVMPSELDCMR